MNSQSLIYDRNIFKFTIKDHFIIITRKQHQIIISAYPFEADYLLRLQEDLQKQQKLLGPHINYSHLYQYIKNNLHQIDISIQFNKLYIPGVGDIKSTIMLVLKRLELTQQQKNIKQTQIKTYQSNNLIKIGKKGEDKSKDNRSTTNLLKQKAQDLYCTIVNKSVLNKSQFILLLMALVGVILMFLTGLSIDKVDVSPINSNTRGDLGEDVKYVEYFNFTRDF